MKFLKYILLISFIVCFLSCEEEPFEPELFGVLTGEVVDNETELPLDKVTITTNPPSTVLSTDSGGLFSFDNIRVGTYSVRAVKDGYLTKLESITVYKNQTTNLIIRLTNDTLSNINLDAAVNPTPENGSIDIPSSVELSWENPEGQEPTNLLYSVNLFSADMSESTPVLTNSSETSVLVEGLSFGATYYWQVEISEGSGNPTYGPVWGFSTLAFPDHRYLFARETDGKYDIYSANETGDPIKLTNNNANNWRPRMNPSRTKIAFISNLGIEPHIYVMNRDGSDPTKITSTAISGFNNLELDYSWSPDGAYLIYMNNSKLYRVGADGNGTTQLAEAITNYTFTECDWSSTGNNILVRVTGNDSYNSFIYGVNDQGDFEQQITNNENGHTGGPAIGLTGNILAYTQDISGYQGDDGRQLDAHIFIRDLTFNTVVDVSGDKPAGTNDLDPRFSPNGAKIIFTNSDNDGLSPKDIWIMDTDGENRELLFENAEMPDWK